MITETSALELDVIAVGAHPDDCEIGCGGTLASLANQGLRVGIIDLTRGELGTRGTIANRDAEGDYYVDLGLILDKKTEK